MWAALRRAYPDAMTDRHVHEAAISNLAFVYGASYETTANAAMHTLAALALDQDSQTAIVEVPPPPLLRVPRRVSWTGSGVAPLTPQCLRMHAAHVGECAGGLRRIATSMLRPVGGAAHAACAAPWIACCMYA